MALNVRVPVGVQPGMQLQMRAPFGLVVVVVPPDARANQVIQVNIPLPAEMLRAPILATSPAGLRRRGQVLVTSVIFFSNQILKGRAFCESYLKSYLN